MELLIIFLLVGGGFLIALGTLVLASFKKSRRTRVGLCSVALVGLIAQGACWLRAVGIGKATSGGGGDAALGVVLLAGIIWLAWSALLIAGGKSVDEKVRTKDEEA